MQALDFLPLVDHTILKPEATSDDVRKATTEALELGTASVCVNGRWVKTVHGLLQGSKVLTCSVVAFPLGSTSEASLRYEVEQACLDGADEIDMVIPVGVLKDGSDAAVKNYIAAARSACGTATLKVILETSLLSRDEIRRACTLAVEADADFVKTSTGFNAAGGASLEAVALMREVVGPDIGVKASGGIRSLADVVAMIEAGANRLGLSSTVAIAEQLRFAQNRG